jgi:hypothetical protein
MDVDGLGRALEAGHFLWRKHALERMAEQAIPQASALRVVFEGQLIEEYETDRPFPSGLFFASPEGRAIHVVASYDAQAEFGYVITVYEPDEEHFESDMKTRRKK